MKTVKANIYALINKKMTVIDQYDNNTYYLAIAQ